MALKRVELADRVQFPQTERAELVELRFRLGPVQGALGRGITSSFRRQSGQNSWNFVSASAQFREPRDDCFVSASAQFREP